MFEDDRLPAELWIKAHIRRCMQEGVPATVVHRGESTGGTLLLKVNQLEHGCKLMSQVRDMDGNLGWLPALGGALVEEQEADDYIARAVKRDPDLWVVEVEARDGWHPFEGKVL